MSIRSIFLFVALFGLAFACLLSRSEISRSLLTYVIAAVVGLNAIAAYSMPRSGRDFHVGFVLGAILFYAADFATSLSLSSVLGHWYFDAFVADNYDLSDVELNGSSFAKYVEAQHGRLEISIFRYVLTMIVAITTGILTSWSGQRYGDAIAQDSGDTSS